jgi:hypothetical protein
MAKKPTNNRVNRPGVKVIGNGPSGNPWKKPKKPKKR